jgi:hypothetical protein
MSYPKTQAFAEKYAYDILKYNYVEHTIDEYRSIYINNPKAIKNLKEDFELYHKSIPPFCNKCMGWRTVEEIAERVDWDKVHKYIKQCDDIILEID